MGLSVEQLVNTNYVRYENMTNIVNQAFVGSSATEINIYIDLYSALKILYSNKSYDINDYSSVTSCVINMCAHYREFFRTRFRTETKFFIVWSKNTPYVNKQFYLDYNKKNEFMMNSNKIVEDMIKNNIELLETLCPYLPDIHFVKGTFETGVIMYDLICREELTSPNPHMIITKDIYNYQLASMRDNIVILRPKKSKGADVSYYINKNNLYSVYLQERKIDYSNYPKTISPCLLTLLMSLSSSPERNMKMLLNVKNAIGKIDKAVSEYKFLNGYNSDLSLVWNGLDTSKFSIGPTTFEHRFKAIDIQFQHTVYITTAECASISLRNLYDPDNVRSINDKYFKKNPLDLNRL